MSNGSTTWTYTYDANGMRTGRTNGTTTYTYVYNGSQLVQMTVGNDILYFTYDAYGLPMTVTHNGTVYYYVTNIQGDVVAILDSTGVAVARYFYDAWGNEISYDYGIPMSTIGQLNPLRYRGYVYDQETGLYYVSSRYYDPEIGRWINADNQISGVGGDILGYNVFAYCMNNPVNMSDPSGNWPRWITATVAAVAAVVAVVATVVAAPVVATVAATVSVVATVAYVAQSHHYDKRKAKNINLPAKKIDAVNEGWKSSEDHTNPQADCHQYTAPDKSNVKFVSPDGHKEVIYNSAGDMVLDSRDIGTYNFSPSGTFWGGLGHFFADMVPWYLFGNDDDDPGPLANEIIRLFE